MNRVLIGAYACEPNQGSEPGVGWHWALEAANTGFEVWVVTRANNREAIEEAITKIDAPTPHFEYLDLPRPLRWLKAHLGHPGLVAYYYLWQLALARRARRLHRHLRFDVTHHVTFVNDSLPSGLCLVPVPFVWGPIGGSTHRLPRRIRLDLPLGARIHELGRTSMQFLLLHFDPFVALTRRRASLILPYTREAQQGLPKKSRPPSKAILHLGVSENDPPPRPSRLDKPDEDFVVLTGGRLVHWKGYDVLIEGFATFMAMERDMPSRLLITGEGPFEKHLRTLVARHGLDESVRFLGRLPGRREVFELMSRCHLYALPTFRDGPPFALLEAMAVGVPVLCLDLGATAETIPSKASLKITATSRQTIVTSIAEALAWTASNPEKAVALGQAGRRYAVQHYEWSRLRTEIRQCYVEVTSKS